MPDHSKFIKNLENTGLIFRASLERIFTDQNISHWLESQKWISDSNIPCLFCKYKEENGTWFSETKCKENVSQGGSCYRETLKNHFIPFLKNVLEGKYPAAIVELTNIVHKKGPIWDGIGDFNLLGMIFHELGGGLSKEFIEKHTKK